MGEEREGGTRRHRGEGKQIQIQTSQQVAYIVLGTAREHMEPAFSERRRIGGGGAECALRG